MQVSLACVKVDNIIRALCSAKFELQGAGRSRAVVPGQEASAAAVGFQAFRFFIHRYALHLKTAESAVGVHLEDHS